MDHELLLLTALMGSCSEGDQCHPRGEGAQRQKAMQVYATERVIVWQVGKACMPCPVLPNIGWQKGFKCCMQAEVPEPIHLKMQ